jgi:hypothetical protein
MIVSTRYQAGSPEQDFSGHNPSLVDVLPSVEVSPRVRPSLTLDTGMARSVPFGSGLDGDSELQTAAGRRGGGGTHGRKRKVDAVTDDGGDAAKATKTAKNAQTAKTTGGDGGAGSNATTSSAPFDSSAAQVANANPRK